MGTTETSRRIRRASFTERQRIELAEDDLDVNDDRYAGLTSQLRRMNATLTGILISLLGILLTVVVTGAVK